jgi:hypothetical protein
MSNLLLKKNITSLEKQLKWLQRSYNICKAFDLKKEYSEQEFDDFETLSGRFSRSVDFLVRKVFRSLDDIEFENQGTLIDTVNNSHKRGLFKDMNDIRRIRDIRNEIVHEYLDENLADNFSELLELAPKLIRIIENTIKYSEQYLK